MLPEIPGRLKTTRLPKNKQVLDGIKGWFVCLLAVFSLSSCQEKECVYHDYRHVNEKGWSAGDTLIFDIPVTDTLSAYQVELDVRNTTSYKYKEIYIMVEMSYGDEPQKAISSDLICYPLTDPEGIWSGIGWGTILQNSIPFRSVHFAHPGNLRYRIYHKMNDPVLIGIRDVGIKITKK